VREIPDEWIKFALATLGLGLAFAAALFSTVSAESGNLWATVVLASGALLLAGIVGVTTVPFLARRVAASRVRQALQYDVTRAGVVYIIITLVLGIAALNTGNNLLYIIVAAMLAAVLASGVVSAVVLRRLELDVRLPDHVFARQAVAGRILLRNPRRWLPSFSIRVVPAKEDRKRWAWERETFTLPSRRGKGRRWLRMPDLRLRRVSVPSSQHIFDGEAYFPFLAAGEQSSASLELRFARRGLYQQDSFGLATRFPFALFSKTRSVPLQREVLVYPPVEPSDEFFEVLPLITGELESFVHGRGYDLYRIRDYMPEDSARFVDWKASAKSGALKLREFSREDERKLRIVFDNPAPGQVPTEAYERVVALAASLAWNFASLDTETSFVAQGHRCSDIHFFLRYLALAQPAAEGGSVLDQLPLSDDYNLIFTARALAELPVALRGCSYFVFFEDIP
jgi:uncharacterized protein (DUF58 family)